MGFGFVELLIAFYNLSHMHLMAYIFALLRDMCKQYQQCISLMQYFTEHEG